jgi:hypothetical protein
MNWIDIASIIFACVTANHLGLIAAIERIIKRPLPIINCPKCFTFWSVLACEVCHVGFPDMYLPLAISFLSSYLALWLELLEAYIDTLYTKLYDKIYPTNDDTPPAGSHKDNPDGPVSQLQQTN